MRKLVILSLATILTVSCNAQEKNKGKKSTDISQNEKSINQEPKGTWEVHKELDENGNIIRYDSIYSWSSFDDLKHFKKADLDSIMSSFQSRFSSQLSNLDNDVFSGFFENDSIFMNQFFDDDFFNRELKKQMPDMKTIHKQMMEMRNRFFKDRGLILAEPDTKSDNKNNE